MNALDVNVWLGFTQFHICDPFVSAEGAVCGNTYLDMLPEVWISQLWVMEFLILFFNSMRQHHLIFWVLCQNTRMKLFLTG